MADNFLNGIDRISSFAYHIEPQTRRSPIPQEIFHEPDIPLDAFDKELLAECPAARSQPVEYAQLFEDGRVRMFLPPTTMHALPTTIDAARTLRDGPYATPVQTRQSSSSSTAAASSPTVAALQNRQSFHSSGSDAMQASRTGENRMYSDHAVGIMASGADSLRQSAQGQSEPSQQSQIVRASRTQGGISRMGLGHAPPIVQSMPLIAAAELPDRYKSIFPFPIFNAVQSKCFRIAFGSNDNLVVSAPTGSGKTAIMELAICQLLHTSKAADFKVVYQAPTKSLCSERMRDWSGKFASLDLTCAELTGDTEHAQLKNVQSASIIITTPEKWDSVTRKWKDNARLMKIVKLFLIDEVHILKERRGATLEAVVSRMKSTGSDVRFVALSATVPNSDDIATWLGKAPGAQHLPANREVFGEECRPVKLEKHVWAIKGPPNDFAFDKVLDTSLKEALAKHSRKKPTLIFCTTRKMAADTAKMLASLFAAYPTSQRLWPAPKKSYRMIDSELSKIVPTGVAFHHGGVDAADRRAIEEGFLDSDISIICCTSTLAVGVNLPCYLVIIKGTVTWNDKGIQEYPDLEIMQMLGRAGRPQFESSACAVILTRPEKEQHYKKMVSGKEILESCLHLNLIEHLNSEIGLGTVSDITSAKKWLASTFMFVRLQKNPRHYQLEGQVEQDGHDDLLASICAKDISLLQEIRLVFDVPRFKCTEFGDAMARYYIKFDTMKTILAMAPKAKTSEIISTLAQASEFSDIRFKSGEKGFYKELNGDVGIKFPIKVDIAQHSHKVSLLVQSELGGSLFPNHEKWKKHKTQFNIDRNMVFSHMSRLIRCVIDCQLQSEDAVSVRHALELARSLAARVWDNSPFQMKQIEAIGEAGVRKLAQAGIRSIETLQNTEPHRIEHILNRHPPFGQKVLAKAVEFPNLHVSVKEMGKERHPGHWIKIKFKAEVRFINEKLPIIFRKKSVYVCFLAETSDGRLIDFRRFAAKKLENGQEILLSVQLIRPTTSINCHVMCDEIAGTSRRAELHLEHFPPSYFPTFEPITPKSIVPVPSKANTTAKSASKIPQDCENYGDLDDGDLLAVFDNEENIEVIHDIDQIVLDSNKPANKSLKRAADEISIDQEGELKPYKEPVQLANGNWTCQHTCKEGGKSCKHKCCVEGVEKPAKPGRKKPAKKDTSTKSSSEDMTVQKSAKSRPFDRARSQTEAKTQKLMVPSTHEANGSSNRNEPTVTKSEQMTSALSKLPAHRYERGTAPKLSFIPNPYGLSNNLTDSMERPANQEEETSKDFDLNPLTRFEKHSTSLNDDEFDFEIDDEMDTVTIEKMVSLADQSKISKQPVSVVSKTTISPKSQYREGSGVHNVQADLSTSAHPTNGNSYELAGPTAVAFTDTEGHPATARTWVSTDEVHNLSSPGLGNEADYGAFNAPLTHLSPTATQRWAPTASNRDVHQPQTFKPQEKEWLFVTGESSSPDKVLPKTLEAVEEVEEYADVAVEAFFATLEAADYDVADPPAKKQKLDHDTGELMLSPNAVPNLQTWSTRTSSSLVDPKMSRQPLGTLQHGRNHQPTGSKQDVSGAHEDMLMTEEKKENKAVEEQRKMWEGLKDFYEQFGDYVEIID